MIREEEVYCPPEDLIHGREDEIHITVLYGINSTNLNGMELTLPEQKSFEVRLGHVSIFTTNEEFDVVKIEAYSPGLFHLNQLLKNKVPNTACYSTYKPHATIAYVKKNACKYLVGSDYFKNWKWMANSLVFSSRNGQKTPIRLNMLQPVTCS